MLHYHASQCLLISLSRTHFSHSVLSLLSPPSRLVMVDTWRYDLPFEQDHIYLLLPTLKHLLLSLILVPLNAYSFSSGNVPLFLCSRKHQHHWLLIVETGLIPLLLDPFRWSLNENQDSYPQVCWNIELSHIRLLTHIRPLFGPDAISLSWSASIA